MGGAGWSGGSIDPDRPLCRLFNWTARGCRFGGTCDYRHDCQTCEERGVKAVHPAQYCAMIQNQGGVQSDGAKQK